MALVALCAGSASAQGINVTVNGRFVAFPGQPPVQRFGTVLVPLRGVFEELGASVQYEPATKTILAVKGPTTVSLRLGQAQALVNGESRALSVPAQAVSGTTLVPLRFVSEALGAQVKWEPATRTVRIATGAQTASELPGPGGTGPVTGTITGIFPEVNAVSIRVTGGENTRVPLAPDALVLVRGAQGAATAANLQALRVGDQITVRRDTAGRGTVLEAVYGERRGVVKSIQRLPSGNFIVTLADGSVVEVLPGAPVTMAGRSVQLTDVMAGERVVIRVNPQNQQGIGVAVVTADNPAPTPPARVEVTSFTHNAQGALRAGQTLTVTLRGTPGATGTFSIPGVEGAQNLALRETAPGVYTGTFTIPAGVNIKGASVLASLKAGQASSPVIQAGQPLTIDAAGPTLANLLPGDGATVPPGRVVIFGNYTDAGTGIDRKRTRLVVNNKDVTAQAEISDVYFRYAPTAALPAGRNTVTVIARDAAGNEARRDWAFSVASEETPIKSLTASPTNKTLGPGETLTVRLEAAPGGTAHFTVGSVATHRPLREGPAGVYTGTYTVKRGDSQNKAPVYVAYVTANGRTVTQTAAQSVTIAAGAPNAPIIDTPQEGAAVGGAVTVTGRAAPNATVRLSVSYQGRLLILAARGVVAEQEVKADAQGKWRSSEIRLDPPLGVTNLTYTLRATVVDAAGSESEPATVQFKR